VRDDFAKHINESTVIVSGRRLRASLSSIKEAAVTTMSETLLVFVSGTVGLLPLASLTAMVLAHGFGFVPFILALLVIMKAILGPLGAISVALVAFETSALCGLRESAARAACADAMCGYRGKLHATMAVVTISPVLCLILL
jgi:hypothetical protein